jgi:hypothetical protein
MGGSVKRFPDLRRGMGAVTLTEYADRDATDLLALLQRHETTLSEILAWPPRSNERIFYGKRTCAPKSTRGKKR